MAGYLVEKLSSLCFYKNPQIVTVNLGNYPFAGNSMYKAFYNCSSLTSVTNINSNVVNMASTFFSCSQLIDAPVIPNSVENMTSTFTNCKALTNFNAFPINVIVLNGTFMGCNKIQSAPDIPESVVYMNSTFKNCNSLSVAPTLPTTINSLSNTFYNTGLIDAPYIPDSVEYMDYAFAYSKNLKNVSHISNNCKSLLWAFAGCESLNKLPASIPNSVISMARTFDGCYSLTSSPTIPNSVTSMVYCFSRCNHLAQAPVLPSGLKSIDFCFNGCTALTTAPLIPVSVTNIDSAFSNSGITASPVINHLSEINTGIWGGCNGIFKNCENLTTIGSPFPSSVRNISYACQNCTKLTDSMAKTLISEIDTLEDFQMNYTFSGCSNVINPNLSSLKAKVNMAYAFENCTKLTGCTLPPNCVNASSAFQFCTSLVTMPTLPNGIKDISDICLSCNKLTTASIIPATVTSIAYAFYNCENLTGTINILSPNINTAASAFHGISVAHPGRRKNVYIPFKYANGVNTVTYDTLIWCGYTTNGSEYNVYLMDNNLRPS